MHKNEEFLAGIRAKALISKGDEATSNWVKYRTLTSQRQIWTEINHARQMKLVKEGPEDKKYGPYEYNPALVERVRNRLARSENR